MEWPKGCFYREFGLLLAVALILGTVLPAAAAPWPFSRQMQVQRGTAQGYVPGEVIVKFKDEV
ncbi:MAG: hypothetical protein AB1776_07000 [Bacillota bacterium]